MPLNPPWMGPFPPAPPRPSRNNPLWAGPFAPGPPRAPTQNLLGSPLLPGFPGLFSPPRWMGPPPRYDGGMPPPPPPMIQGFPLNFNHQGVF